MRKIFWLIPLLIVSSQVYPKCRADDIPKVTARPQIKGPQDEVKVSDLVWQDHTKIPKDAIAAIKKFFPYPESTSYSLFDLNYDGKDEIIFKNSDYSGSGGQGFSILENQKGKWVEIIGWGDAVEAKQMIRDGQQRLAAQKAA